MEATTLFSSAPLQLQLRSSAPSHCTSRAPSVSRIALPSHFVNTPCSVSSSSGWRTAGTGVRVRAAAGEKEKPAQGEKEGETEKVDYRLYQALMRGGEEVISVLKEITELVSAFFSSFSFSLSLSLFIGGQSVEKTNSEMAVGSWKT
jgi:hypothetical protein